VRFPLFAWDAEEGRYAAEHHPFTMPLPEDLALLDTDPAKVRAQAYDLVVNGEECAGGTIRCHDPLIQSKIFSLMGLTPEQAEEKFGFLLSALRFGAPPHGGIAFGVDALHGPDQHPGLHRIPQDRSRDRPDDGCARNRRRAATERATCPND
jgi:aspartyl-tRNA synthetase